MAKWKIVSKRARGCVPAHGLPTLLDPFQVRKHQQPGRWDPPSWEGEEARVPALQALLAQGKKYHDADGRCTVIFFESIAVRGRCGSPEVTGRNKTTEQQNTRNHTTLSRDFTGIFRIFIVFSSFLKKRAEKQKT